MIEKDVEKNGRIIARIYYFADAKSSQEILREISRISSIGYAGFRKKVDLKKFLLNTMIQKNGSEQMYLDNKEVIRLAAKTLRKISYYLDKKIYLFIFPTNDVFVKNKMNGVSGFTPWKNTIQLFINKKKGFERALEKTLIHEAAHAITLNHKKIRSLRETLAFEGIAENFVEKITGNPSKFSKAITKESAHKIFYEVKPYLDKPSGKLYNELFFGTGKYPLWAGYTISYCYIKSFLKTRKSVDWKNLLKNLVPKHSTDEISW